MIKYKLKKVIKTDNKEITELNIKDIDDITYLGIMNSIDVNGNINQADSMAYLCDLSTEEVNKISFIDGIFIAKHIESISTFFEDDLKK
jgi:site-specific recombinase